MELRRLLGGINKHRLVTLPELLLLPLTMLLLPPDAVATATPLSKTVSTATTFLVSIYYIILRFPPQQQL